MSNYSPKQLIDDFVRQFTVGANEKLNHNQLCALLESLLRRLDLVSREEFDAQASVLARTRQKLQQLEEKVDNFEIEDKFQKDG